LEDMIRDIASSYPQAGLSISGSSDILVDNSLYSVIENIIRNAIVHGGADHIEVSLDETPECSIIEISDNGAGMSKLALEHAFEEGFSYGKNKGTGIGLYLVRNLMDNIGGTIVLQNRYPHGVTAIIKIKKGKEA